MTRRGQPFGKNSLYDILRNEKYTSLYIWNRLAPADVDGRTSRRRLKPRNEWVCVENGMPQIIPTEQWQAVQDEMPREYGCGPLIVFLFVAEKYRGNRLSEQMVNAACNVAKEQGFSAIYLMSGEVGLYEKYSFTKVGDYKTIYGSVDQLFSKTL